MAKSCRTHEGSYSMTCEACNRVLPPLGPSFVTDDELRAECERRRMFFATGEICRERDSANRRAETASTRCIELERERDEWKRRAEAAEAKLAAPMLVGQTYTSTESEPFDYGPFMRALGRAAENGPGLAATKPKPPDNEVWGPLLEDLLA